MDYVLTILKIFAFIGIADTLYLIWHKVNKTDVACIGFPREWCRRVQYSKQSVTFGVPNSVAGFLMYAGILLLVYTQPISLWWAIQFLVAFGFIFSMYFLYVQAFVLRAFCTWCVISAINFTVMFWAVFIH